MTEKRFTLEEFGLNFIVNDNGRNLTAKQTVDRLNELADENEQLKQRNNRQYEQLDRLYNLIEQKDWRALNDILDDFKKCDEQLQKEWRTYGDMND